MGHNDSSLLLEISYAIQRLSSIEIEETVSIFRLGTYRAYSLIIIEWEEVQQLESVYNRDQRLGLFLHLVNLSLFLFLIPWCL